MYNFSAVVDNIILEAQQNQQLENIIQNSYFKGLFDSYKAAYGIDLANDPNLEQALNLVASAGQRFPARDVLAPAIPILDAFELIHTYLSTINPQLKTKTDLPSLLTAIESAITSATSRAGATQTDPKIKTILDGVITKIQSSQTTDPLDYQPTGPKTANAHRTLTSEFDKLSQTAIEQLSRDTIQTALQKIITKRVTISNRILAGKGIRKPFQSTLLVPLFDYYKNYTTGGNILYDKIPGDFKDAVDQLSIDKVISVAILSGDYYLSLLRKRLAQTNQQSAQLNQIPQQNRNVRAAVGRSQAASQTSGYQQSGVGRSIQTSSLTNFDAYVKDLLTEAAPQRGLTKDVYDGTARAIGTARLSDFVLFVKEGRSMWLPETQQQAGQQQTGPIIYNLETISKDTSKEAQALYAALRSMAYYTRETSGFGYRSQQFGKAASSLAGFGGAKLYGGPGT